MPDGTLTHPSQPSRPAAVPKGAVPDASLLKTAEAQPASPRRSRLTVRIALVGAAALALLGGLSLGGAVKGAFSTRTVAVPSSQVISGGAEAVDGATIQLGALELHLQGIEAPPAGFVCRDG